MTKKITIPYFSKGMKFVSPLFFGAGAYLLATRHPIWGTFVALIGFIILTTRYVTEINLVEKMYKDYLFFLGFHMNEDIEKFNGVDRIVVTKGGHSHTANTRSRDRQVDWSDYTGTLVFDDGRTLDLLTRNERRELVKGLKDFADFLQVGIEDRTSREYYWVDLTKVGVEN
jgi:hypothetical protein